MNITKTTIILLLAVATANFVSAEEVSRSGGLRRLQHGDYPGAGWDELTKLDPCAPPRKCDAIPSAVIECPCPVPKVEPQK